MNLLVPVSTIMTKKLITVQPDESIDEIYKIFKINKIHHLPVVKKGRLKGIITKADFLCKTSCGEKKAEMSGANKRILARELITAEFPKLEVTDNINVAIEVFRENQFRAIPVVEGEILVGLLTTFDIIELLAQKAQ